MTLKNLSIWHLKLPLALAIWCPVTDGPANGIEVEPPFLLIKRGVWEFRWINCKGVCLTSIVGAALQVLAWGFGPSLGEVISVRSAFDNVFFKRNLQILKSNGSGRRYL